MLKVESRGCASATVQIDYLSEVFVCLSANNIISYASFFIKTYHENLHINYSQFTYGSYKICSKLHTQWTVSTTTELRHYRQPTAIQKEKHTECLHTIDKKLNSHTRTLNFLHSHANHPINTLIQLDKMRTELFELLPFMTLQNIIIAPHAHSLTHPATMSWCTANVNISL